MDPFLSFLGAKTTLDEFASTKSSLSTMRFASKRDRVKAEG